MGALTGRGLQWPSPTPPVPPILRDIDAIGQRAQRFTQISLCSCCCRHLRTGCAQVGPGEVRAAKWHPHREDGAVSRGAFYRHMTLVQFDQFLDQRKADARPFMCAPARTFDTMEPVEDSGTSDSGMPVPVSLMRTTANAPSANTSILRPPSSVNLKAFETRLRTIFSHISWSTKTGWATAVCRS